MSNNPKFIDKKYVLIYGYVTCLFMIWGIALSMCDVLNKHFQNVLHIDKSKSGLIQLSVFGAYAVMSIPAGLFMKKFGYKKGVLLGLILFVCGTQLFIPAANNNSFTMFRIALFILGTGMATLETVAHPFAAALGDQRTSDRRLNFSQSFNAVGTMIGPAIGTYFLLRVTHDSNDLSSVKYLYLSIGIVIALFAIAFAFTHVPKVQYAHHEAENVEAGQNKPLIKHPHFIWSVAAQFFNVAAQSGTWAFFINYGHEKMGFSEQTAGNYMVLFMAMMTIGRIVGTALMKFIAPNKLLAAFALGSVLCCLIVAQNLGWTSFIALLMINFFFSIMYPTIFSLGLKDLGAKTQQASSYISMGMVGGAIFPYFMGKIANHDVAVSYYLPIICYVFIFLFAVRLYKSR
ncbi:L-fucose:H+ symporter permease [Arachidicoccus ginsenosidimutans]|uniref:L-fucose:H+ symporter permease n=1 Tax=Arachidicoccus sp. BS20 TaxID=1850526 RepID=UPI0007F069C1|nr:L-fucose:H+ symporter permease [Arachidicoccus sp. BS20]ANI90063.1 L-fucose:H+ symporter permease [Arachidicoccus sp. BS20]